MRTRTYGGVGAAVSNGRGYPISGFRQRVPIGRQDPANTNEYRTIGDSTAQLFSSVGIVLSAAVLVLSASGARNRMTAQPSDSESRLASD